MFDQASSSPTVPTLPGPRSHRTSAALPQWFGCRPPPRTRRCTRRRSDEASPVGLAKAHMAPLLGHRFEIFRKLETEMSWGYFEHQCFFSFKVMNPMCEPCWYLYVVEAFWESMIEYVPYIIHSLSEWCQCWDLYSCGLNLMRLVTFSWWILDTLHVFCWLVHLTIDSKRSQD